MKLTEYSIVCDENIHPAVVNFIKDRVKFVKTTYDLNLLSADDEKILSVAHIMNSIVLTKKVPFTGIVYLRPGHIIPLFTIEMLKTLFENEFELTPPFMLIAERTKLQNVKVRLRSL